MEGTEDIENGRKQKVSTLVFIDLETTGLPSEVGARNVHITEMSLVAIDRNNFETDQNFRVLNKISLCIRPRSMISPVCMNLTGLYNDILENQKEFDDSVPKLLEYFFRRLEKPICLLAHNGNRFDFPVLQAELNRLNYSLGSDIVCADTLVGFRSICLLKKQEAETQKKSKEINNCYENIGMSEEDMDKLLLDDIECFSQIDVELTSINEKKLEPGVIKTFLSGDISHLSEENNFFSSKDTLSPSQNEKTPEQNEVCFHSNENFKVHRKRKILDSTFLPQNQYKKSTVPAKRTLFHNSVKRNLFSDTSPEIHNITKFSLAHLYNHFFNENPQNSHFAETDCVSLSKVCQKIHHEFLEWVDKNNVEFSTINALY